MAREFEGTEDFSLEDIHRIANKVLDDKVPYDERVRYATIVFSFIKKHEGELNVRSIRGYDIYYIYDGYSLSSLNDAIKSGNLPVDDEIIAKAVFNYKVNDLRKYLMEVDIFDLVKFFYDTTDSIEKEIAREVLSARKEDLKKETSGIEGITMIDILTAQLGRVLRNFSKMIEELMPGKITSEVDLPLFSQAQIKMIDKPTRWYANEAFRNGIWRHKWGDPRQYGINVESEIRFVSYPQSQDFVDVIRFLGINFPESWIEIYRRLPRYG